MHNYIKRHKCLQKLPHLYIKDQHSFEYSSDGYSIMNNDDNDDDDAISDVSVHMFTFQSCENLASPDSDHPRGYGSYFINLSLFLFITQKCIY